MLRGFLGAWKAMQATIAKMLRSFVVIGRLPRKSAEACDPAVVGLG
jgi:hypothetical protein